MESPGRRSSVRYNGREVENPVMRVVVAVVAMTLAVGVLGIALFAILPAVTFIFGLFVLLGAVVLASLPLHFLLRALGRRGFVERSSGSVKVEISSKGFHKR